VDIVDRRLVHRVVAKVMAVVPVAVAIV
jgi:hypothetical protein